MIDRKQQVARVKIESIARSQRDNLQSELLRLIFKTETLNALVLDRDGNIAEFERVAAALRDDDTIQAFALAPGGIITWVYPFSPDNSMLLGQDMLDGNLGCHEAVTARHGAPLTLAGPVLLPNGDAALVGRLSVFLPDASGRPQYWGIAAILLRFPDVLTASDLYMLDSMDIDFGLWRTSPHKGGALLIAGSADSEKDAGNIEMPVTILNAHWLIRMSAGIAWYRSLEPWLYVGMSVLLSLFLATLVQRNHDLTQIRTYLEAIAYRDALTGALNRRGLLEELQRRITLSPENKFALYYFDLNNFKGINDTYGHEAGDRVLQLFAEVVRAHAPVTHSLGRIGGDEFVLLLNGSPLQERDKAAFVRMRADLSEGLPELNIPGPITFSMGSAVYPDGAVTVDSLLSCADTAMYQDKERAKALG
ncbi:MAG: diguanylate cyclase [Desulfovibrio sp.]